MRHMLLAVLIFAAPAAFAQSDSLVDSYRSALEYSRAEAARQKAEGGLAREMRAAGLAFTDPRDHSERNPVVADYGVVLSKAGRWGAAAFVASRMEDDTMTLAIARHSVFGDVELGAYASPAEFLKQTGGSAALKAFADDLRANYPYVKVLPGFVDAKTRATMTAEMAAARARAALVEAVARDLAAMGMTITTEAEGAETVAQKGGVTVRIITAGASSALVNISVNGLPGLLKSYPSIPELRAKTANLAEIQTLLHAAGK